MILRHRDWDIEKKLERSMTIKEFIKDIVLADSNKNYKYYRITMNESIDGKKNFIIYYQDSKVKSHHSTGIEFDYKEMLNQKICLYYLERTIRVEDVINMDLDFELKKKYKQLKNAEVCKGIKGVIKKWEQEILERDNIKKVFKDSVSKDDLIICIRQLIENIEKKNMEHSELAYEIDKCKKRQNDLQQQIKWLEYRLNNKI
ncbi:hypothetical protein [Clostridium botulinum]|uniref:hypothetical protein n=1 Tax=Clostridium botulinum TaxID=1491 RepID=UPI0007E0B002|nr:hypothetical protein [Clostridium botulinum]KEI83384.1 hypothetical protein N487_00280 [Clostridium botulinum B2 331]KEI93978.1 hypothetical protein N491_00280 [Clostridium botulinum B2 275]